MPIRKKILVKGFVQGVSYRKQTLRVARNLRVKGWVRNVSDGNVEAVLEGDEQAVDTLIAWCAFGPKKGRVEEVQVKREHIDRAFNRFSILADRKAA
jgi:acylphosphatase